MEGLSRKTIEVGLGAMKTVALANGVFDEAEQALLESVAKALRYEGDLGAIEAVGPEAAAAAIDDPKWRERLVQALILVSLIDGEPSEDEAKAVDAFAKALGVDEPRTKVLRHVMGGHTNLVRFDLFRRAQLPRMLMKLAYEKEGVRGVYKFVKTVVKGGGDYEEQTAWKYRKLGLLPENTLGRQFWAHMTKNGFAMPGEIGGLMESGGIQHDALHVMAGYDTDPIGETQIASFAAGCLGEDEFGFVLMVTVMFHIGIKLAPLVTPATGVFDPELVRRAFERGRRASRELFQAYDFHQFAAMPIDDVRRHFGIQPA